MRYSPAPDYARSVPGTRLPLPTARRLSGVVRVDPIDTPRTTAPRHRF